METSSFDNIFIFLCLNDHDWCSYKPCSVRQLKSLCDDSDLQTSEYRIYYFNVKLTTINTGVAFTSNRWDFVWEIKYWGLRTLNIIILTYFSIKWIKETYLWCGPVFVGVNSTIYSGFFSCYCLNPCHSLQKYEVKVAKKNSRRSGPCLLEGGLRLKNPSYRSFFRPEANFYHRCTSVNV